MTSSESTLRQFLWSAAIGASILLAVISTIFSLTHAIYEVFPFLYFLPIIIFVYRYPQRGVLFSLVISIVFLSLVYYFGNFNPMLVDLHGMVCHLRHHRGGHLLVCRGDAVRGTEIPGHLRELPGRYPHLRS
jgi:hypothetical protein